MNISLMLDTLNMITDKTQSSIQQTIRKPKSTSQKLRFVSLNLLQLKHQIYEWLDNMLSNCKDVQKVRESISQIKEQALKQVSRHRLHLLLKNKLRMMKKQSSLLSTSMLSSSFNYEDTKLNELQQSLLHIQRDLNIQQQDEEFGVSAIVQRSRVGLGWNSRQDNDLNVSVVSGYSVFDIGQIRKVQEERKVEVKFQCENYGDHSGISQRQLKPQIKYIQQKQLVFKQQTPMNNQSLTTQEQLNLHAKLNQDQQNPLTGIKVSPTEPVIGLTKVMKKKKKSVYTSMGLSLNKQGMLGNLLEESYQHCVENQQSNK